MTDPLLHYVTCPGASALWSLHGHLSLTEPVPAVSSSPNHSHRMAYWEWNETGNPQHPHVVVCVHGLTRQGRDFDTLARALSKHARVICPDVAGRGESDWLADASAYQVPQYAGDMVALLTHLQAQQPMTRLDWVGTSLGGLIGMVIASPPTEASPVAISRLVLNDVGPTIEWSALDRIGRYLGAPLRFDSPEQAAAALWAVSSSFGPHTPEEWLKLSLPMLRPTDEGQYRLHYDPSIAQAFKAMTPETAQAAESALWLAYDAIAAKTLLLRGADSDLLSRATAHAMTERGPRAKLVEFTGVGHAPTLIAADQVAAIVKFLLAGAEADGQ